MFKRTDRTDDQYDRQQFRLNGKGQRMRTETDRELIKNLNLNLFVLS